MEEVVSKKDAIKEAYLLQEQSVENEKQLHLKQSELAKTVDKLNASREKYVEVQEVAQKERRKYEEADAMYKQAVIGVAARFVREGEPCPATANSY